MATGKPRKTAEAASPVIKSLAMSEKETPWCFQENDVDLPGLNSVAKRPPIL